MSSLRLFWRTQIGYYLIPALVLLGIVAIEWHKIMALNNGIFSYALDDAYIHLSMAKTLRTGWYGINPGEIASSSSSILWPFLLTPFAYFTLYEKVPLILNIIFSLITLWFFIYIILLAHQPSNTWQKIAMIFLFCLLVFILNLVVLIFMGMEHSLQVLLSVLLVGGLILESRSQHLPWWLAVVIILGPLVRYENLALSVPAIFYLFYRKHYKPTLLISLLTFGSLALFSLFLYYIEQPLLPASILAKSMLGVSGSLFKVFSANLIENLSHIDGISFLLFLLYFALFFIFSYQASNNGPISLVLISAFLLHLIFGKIYSYSRYELYLYAAIWLWLSYLVAGELPQLKEKRIGNSVLLITLSLLVYQYTKVMITLPIAANNIFEQQYQIGLFAKNYLKGPVAVNDIGLVSFNNPNYVLDLSGLGNTDIFKQRVFQKDSSWMNQLVERSDIQLAIIYKNWFHAIPDNWRLLGCMYLSKKRVSTSQGVVYFYATRAKYQPFLVEKLEQFKMKLPTDVVFKAQCGLN